jgi:hypothetical protein
MSLPTATMLSQAITSCRLSPRPAAVSTAKHVPQLFPPYLGGFAGPALKLTIKRLREHFARWARETVFRPGRDFFGFCPCSPAKGGWATLYFALLRSLRLRCFSVLSRQSRLRPTASRPLFVLCPPLSEWANDYSPLRSCVLCPPACRSASCSDFRLQTSPCQSKAVRYDGAIGG